MVVNFTTVLFDTPIYYYAELHTPWPLKRSL